MTFRPGQRVRFIGQTGTHLNSAQNGNVYHVLEVAGALVFLRELGRHHGGYYDTDFQSAEIAVGDIVTFHDVRGLTYIPQGTQGRVIGIQGDLYRVRSSWYRATRFEEAPKRPPPPVYPYSIHGYPGCCGARIAFFNGETLKVPRVEATMKLCPGHSMVGVLNYNQYNSGGGKILEELGWKLSGVSASNSGKTRPLYHYIYVKTPAIGGEITEKARSFG